MSGSCQNLDPDAVQIQFLTILQIHIRSNRYRTPHIFRQVALRIQQEILLCFPGINFHRFPTMLPGISIRSRFQFRAATNVVKMSVGQKNCHCMQSVMPKCCLYFLSVIRRVEYQHLITVFSVHKITVGLVDPQCHISDTDIAHNTLTFCFLSGSAAFPGILHLTRGSLNINNALDAPDLVNNTVQFLPAADLEGRLQSSQPLPIGSGVHGHDIDIFLRQRLGNIR